MRRRIADGNEWNMPEANLFDGWPLFFFSIFLLFFFFLRNIYIHGVILQYLNEYSDDREDEIKKGS